MTDTTDLSKLSSDEIIGKIVNLVFSCDAGKIWTGEANAKLHVLTVILKQAVIREASVGTVSITTEPFEDYPCIDKLTLKDNMKHDWREYDLIPKETHETHT